MGKNRMARALLIPKSGVGTRSTNGSFGSFDLYYIIYGQFTKLWKEWRHQNLSKNNNRAHVSNGNFPVKIMSKTLHWRTRWGRIIYFIIFLPPFLFLSQKSWKWNGASEEKLYFKVNENNSQSLQRQDRVRCVKFVTSVRPREWSQSLSRIAMCFGLLRVGDGCRCSHAIHRHVHLEPTAYRDMAKSLCLTLSMQTAVVKKKGHFPSANYV